MRPRHLDYLPTPTYSEVIHSAGVERVGPADHGIMPSRTVGRQEARVARQFVGGLCRCESQRVASQQAISCVGEVVVQSLGGKHCVDATRSLVELDYSNIGIAQRGCDSKRGDLSQ